MSLPKQHIAIERTFSDNELISLFKETLNQDLLAQLYTRYMDLVYGVCLKYLKNDEEAEDAVNDIYQELLAKILLHSIEHFKSWLYTVTKNHCLMKIRSAKKLVTVEFAPALMQSEDYAHLDEILSKEALLVKLEDCIAKLPEDQNTTIKSFYLSNKCYNEIAEETGFEWNKVRSLIQNGRRNLKICMDKNE